MYNTGDFSEIFGDIGEEIFAIIGVFAFIFIIIGIVGLVFYVLRSLALYTLAKRRGIAAPGLAWVPVASDYTLGAICDNICSFINVKSYNRFVLLGCRILQMALSGLLIQKSISSSFAIFNATNTAGANPEALATSMMGSATALNALSSLVGLAYLIFFLISMYRIFQCYKPENAVLYLILGFFIPVLRDIFLFSVRNAPGSLPERTPQTASYTPAPTPVLAPVAEEKPIEPTTPSASTEDAWDRYTK